MSDKLSAAVVPWIRDSNVQEFTSNLQEVLRQHPETQGASIRWRPNTVIDFRGQNVRPIVQLVVRLDRRLPGVVFENGFVPRAEEEWVHDQMDLWTYVQQNVRSIFVGAGLAYRNAAGTTYWWRPRDRRNIFEYEIFAPGGIDVNGCIGTDHRFANQYEIAFPGGVRREFIRSARQFDENGRVIRIWENGFFLAHLESLALLDELPYPVCGRGLDEIYWTDPDDHTSLVRKRRDDAALSSSNLQDEDPMRQEGAPTVISDLIRGSPPKAAFPRPYTPDSESHDWLELKKEVYFFSDNEYVRIKVIPGTLDDIILFGPSNILTEWPSLKKAGFAKVDAVLPSPNGGGETYFFSQDKYALIKVVPQTSTDYIITGPKKIVDYWPSLKKAAFSRVDAVLPNPNANDEAYFFSGTRYALIKVIPGTMDDYIISGPTVITEAWPSLRKAGFSTVDVAFPSPNGNGEAYFFSGDKYALIKVIPRTNDDYIINGPKNVADNWPSLHKAGFY